MARRHRNLYTDLYSWENLHRAWRFARRGKRGRPAVATFELRAAERLLGLQLELREDRYRPGAYTSFFVHDPKRRLISAAPFRDRVVHHALCQVIEPLFERRFLNTSFANRVGKGTHAAIDCCQRFARRFRYVLPCDVEQFFPAVDHAILLCRLGEVIADEEVLALCRTILASGEGILDAQYAMRYFPGDDLFSVNRPRGLPIGNLTSQFWANVYLDALDQTVKRQLRCPAYLRFADDFLLFADDKATLWRWRAAVVVKLSELRLTLHDGPCHPRPVGEGIPFLGFVVFPHHRRLKRRKGVAYRRRLAHLVAGYRAGEVERETLMASVRGWVEHAKHGDTYRLRRQLFAEHPPFRLPPAREQ